MLVIWRGLGWLAPIIGFTMMVLTQLAIDSVHGDGFYTANSWPKTVAIAAAAVSIGLLGWYLNHIRRGTIVDDASGEVVGKSPSHSLFFIPVEYWALITPAAFLLASM